MADSSPYTKPHFTLSQANSPIRPKPDINKGKSYSGFLFKSLLFALFVVVLPLFPSQAPEFVNQTIITQFWELLHLLFIGIAVAYGLFSRRNVEPDLEIETQSIVDNTSCYVSTMFPVSSVFSDESENPSGYDENRMMMMHCNWNYSQYYESNALMVMDEQCKPQLPPEEDNFSDVRYDGTNVVQAWNSEYNHRQPMVVVAHPYYTIGECDEIVGYKPLGLPVRSLRSTVGDLDSPSNTNESDSSSGSRGSSRSSVKSRDRKFGDLGHYDSDQKFNDAAGSSSPDPWRSRSKRMESEENHGSIAHPSHHRPLSAAETKSESFNSQAFQSTTSLSSNRSTYSSDSVPSDNMNLESEEMGQKKISDGSSSDIMNFQEEDSGGNMAYHGSSPRLKKMGTRENYAIVSHQSHYGSSSEKMNLQEEEPGANMASQRSPPRLRKMATREKYGTVARPSHFRPMSVDETQFESLGSQSFKSTGSCSSRTLLSSLDSVPSENLNLPKEDSGENKSSHGPSSSSPSPPARRRTEKASSQSLHFRGYSVGNLLQDGLKSSLKDEWIDLNGSEVQSHNKDAGLHLQSDTEKHESLAKAPTKGKSVRTRRTSGLTSETMRTGDMCSKQTDEKVEKMPNNVEPVLIRREKLRKGGPDHPSKVINKQGTDENVEKMPDNVEPLLIRREKLRKGGPDHPSKDVSKQSTDEKVEKMPDNNEPVLIRREKLRKGGSDHPSKGVRKQNNDCPCPKSEGTFSSYPKRDKEEPSKNGAKEDLLIEPENSKMSSDEDRMSECVNDSGLDSEVDKKASEFIAKFKAQIRLQKEASMDRSRGLKTMKRVLGDT
ncbi:hypothetical protein QN277_024578 [Acacia crassicarpa]|uniref:Uncharacterized protein n=1 Tax=Acacia crassicarpa TaxID=499986 RepID=A0AAE1MN86_9FABA|nr:hypothetical protein QN277_024578 [Acacia crassicarpa]